MTENKGTINTGFRSIFHCMQNELIARRNTDYGNLICISQSQFKKDLGNPLRFVVVSLGNTHNIPSLLLAGSKKIHKFVSCCRNMTQIMLEAMQNIND